MWFNSEEDKLSRLNEEMEKMEKIKMGLINLGCESLRKPKFIGDTTNPHYYSFKVNKNKVTMAAYHNYW